MRTILTNKENQVYDFILKFQEKHGKSPLLKEVAKGIGIKSKGVVHRYIKSLELSRMIKRDSSKHRGLAMINPVFNISSLRIKSFGKIAAGGPIEAVQDKNILDLEHIFTNEKCFALKVQGDSMIDAGIYDGDWVIVEKRTKALKSKVMVILIDNQDVTLKFVKQLNKNSVELIPANKNLSSKSYDICRISIQGIVIGQIRVY